MVAKAGSLCDNFDTWAKIGAPENVLDQIKFVVKLPFCNVPASFEQKHCYSVYKYYAFIDKELEDLCKGGAISEVKNKPYCVSPLNCVPKKKGKLRLIVDLRYVINI